MVRAAIPWERPKPAHVLLLLPLVALGTWIWHRGKETSLNRGAVLVALRASRAPLLPEASAAGSASRSEPTRYDRESLYEAIDGAADNYLARGFVSALMAIYAYPAASGPGGEISAELHRFETEAGARTQRDAERPSVAVPVAGLAQTVSDGTVLLAVHGRDYLKLTSLTPGPDAAARLESLARATFQEKTP
jgi:hypothetical protein